MCLVCCCCDLLTMCDAVESSGYTVLCVSGLAKANKDVMVNDRLVDGAASDGM